MVSHGRPHSYRGSSLGQDVASCTVKQRDKESAKRRNHRKRKPLKMGPRPARRQKSGGAKGRPSHIGRAGLRGHFLQHFTRNTQVRCNKSKQLSASKKQKWFSNAVSLILMLRTCERASSAGTIKAPPPSPSGKRILSCSANTSHRGANCFPIFRYSIDLDWRTEITGLALQKGLSISQGIPSSRNRATKS